MIYMQEFELQSLNFEEMTYMLRQGLLTNDWDLVDYTADQIRHKMNLSPTRQPALWRLPPKKFAEAILRKAERAISVSHI